MSDRNYLELINKVNRITLILNRFNKEGWVDYEIRANLIDKSQEEFIIKVPYMKYRKVQYLPFIYGGIPVELKYDRH